MDDPLVSIIMGVRNEEKNIRRAINSIIRQTYTNWEFIICDDCSEDNTLAVLKEYQNIDHRIRVINNQKNLRLAASLNRCLSLARGKYIARMDADDESIECRLKEQVEYLEHHRAIDCVGCNMVIYDEQGDKGIRVFDEYPKKEILLYKAPFAHPTIVIRKSVMDALNGYTVSKETMRAEDLDLWFRFYSRKYEGCNIQNFLYRYHESVEDLKKRNLKSAIMTAKVFLKGYKILKFPIYKYAYSLKPIIAALMPNSILVKYYRYRDKKYNKR